MSAPVVLMSAWSGRRGIRKVERTPALHIPLARLALCADCDSCFEIVDVCPACAGTTIISLGRILYRDAVVAR